MWDIPQLYIYICMYIYMYIIEVIMDWDATPSKLCWRWFLTPTMELYAIKKQRFLMNLSFRSTPSEPSLARLANHWDACRHLLFRKHSQSQYCLYIYIYIISIIVVIVLLLLLWLLSLLLLFCCLLPLLWICTREIAKYIAEVDYQEISIYIYIGMVQHQSYHIFWNKHP